MKCNGPVGVVVSHRDVAGCGLNNEQESGKLGGPLHRCSVAVAVLSHGDDVVDDGQCDDANEHPVEPFNEDLEHRVSVVFAA